MTSNINSHSEDRQPLLTQPQPDHEREQNAEYGTAPTSTDTGVEFRRNLGTLDAFGIVVSIVIGSGVFTSTGSIDANVPSPGAALIIWLVGGVLAWTGASTLAELGTAIPGEGGVQPYLQRIYGNTVAFMAAWTWVFLVMPVTLAILSIVFVEVAYSAAGIDGEGGRPEHKLLSILVLVFVSAANCISTKASTRLNGVFVVTKFASILSVVTAGVWVVIAVLMDKERSSDGNDDWWSKSWFAPRDNYNPDGSYNNWKGMGTWNALGYYSAALYAALWAYSGWDKAVYVSAELSRPARQLPLALNLALLTSTLSFLAANAAYYVLLPWDDISTTDGVAVTAFTNLLGPNAGIVAAIVVCVVVAGSLLGNSFVASRMTVAAANKGWLSPLLAVKGRFSRTPSRNEDGGSDAPPPTTPYDAPLNAIVLSVILATCYILLGDFRALLTLNGLGEYSFFFLTVLGAIILRRREKSLERPYKPWIVVPALFVVVSGFVIIRGAFQAPIQASTVLAVWILGYLYIHLRRA